VLKTQTSTTSVSNDQHLTFGGNKMTINWAGKKIKSISTYQNKLLNVCHDFNNEEACQAEV
jgi:hypothetical protein